MVELIILGNAPYTRKRIEKAVILDETGTYPTTFEKVNNNPDYIYVGSWDRNGVLMHSFKLPPPKYPEA